MMRGVAVCPGATETGANEARVVSGSALSRVPSVPMSNHIGPYYLRLMVVDRPGVIADVTAILRDMGVSLESMLQRGRSPGEAVHPLGGLHARVARAHQRLGVRGHAQFRAMAADCRPLQRRKDQIDVGERPP